LRTPQFPLSAIIQSRGSTGIESAGDVRCEITKRHSGFDVAGDFGAKRTKRFIAIQLRGIGTIS
jgi:hypothetical protein